MSKKLILCEKPSVGVAYSRALRLSERRDGYIEGSDYIVTWCIGHLVELANADVYDERYKKWNIADLPILPQKWEYVVSADKAKQFKVVKTLMNSSAVSEIIFATDAGREGELIARLTYEKAGCKKPVKRLWISSMEEKAIIDGFNNLKDGAEYENLYQSALCRAKSDWEVGINATRILTKLYNKKLIVGRVQTPTLAMITERGNAISNFKKEKYFNVCLNGMGLISKIKSQSEAEKIKTECDGQKAVIRSVKREKKTVNPPKLFDLTDLQRTVNRLYGYTAQQTLDYAQSLYESRLLSYPRSDSQYITEDMAGTANEIIGIILSHIPQYKGFSYTPDISKVINDKRVTDHHGIILTAELANANLGDLPDGERKILELVANKLLCATAAQHEYEAVTATIECNAENLCGGYSFTAKGKSVTADGWKAIERLFKGEKSVDGDDSDENPDTAHGGDTRLDLSENQELTADCSISEHFTQPPKAYTEDTLLSAMSKAGAGEITEDVERSGLGTPATRAGIIEKLIKTGFIKRDKKALVATADGAELISIVPDFIKSAKLTADWENTLSLISKGEYSSEEFMGQIEKLVSDIISNAKANIKTELVAKPVYSKDWKKPSKNSKTGGGK